MAVETCPPPAPNSDSIEALYPSGSSPENRFQRHSAICSTGFTPLLLTGALRQVLLQHFASADHIINPYLRNYLIREGAWQPNKETSGIYVEPLDEFNPEVLGVRPAVLLKDGDWNWRKLGINNRIDTDPSTGERIFTGHWFGTHTFFVIAKISSVAKLIGAEIAKILLWFGPDIAEQFNLHRFEVLNQGAGQALKGWTENTVVPVNVAYIASEAWSTVEDAPRLKRIVFRASDLMPDLHTKFG